MNEQPKENRAMQNPESRPNLHVVQEGIGAENDIYTKRFSSTEEETRRRVWEILCEDFLSQYVSPNDTVVDIGAGDGHFIKNIKAKRRIAVDLSPHALELKKFGAEVLLAPATELSQHVSEKVDVIFMSNFLEHLPNKSVLLEVLSECKKILRPGGVVMILQPNIRYVGSAYWDYIDHHIALTEHSLVEALEVSGFSIVRMIPRFLPYTAKSGIGKLVGGGKYAELVRWYLRLPLLWRVFGQQTFVVATLK